MPHVHPHIDELTCWVLTVGSHDVQGAVVEVLVELLELILGFLGGPKKSPGGDLGKHPVRFPVSFGLEV